MKRLFFANILFAFIGFSCDSNVKPGTADCNLSDLQITIQSFVNTTGCSETDGSLTVIATGGQEGYQYKLNGGTLQANPVFDNLGTGIYTVEVIDEVGCSRSISQTIESASGVVINDLTTTVSGCGMSDGAITVTASGGNGLEYSLNGGAFSTDNIFSNLSAGNYSIVVRDESGCQFSASVKVDSGTPFATIKEIIDLNCAVGTNCHDGNGAGTSRNFSIEQNIINQSALIQTVTSAKSMPPSNSGFSLTDEQIELISCWVEDGSPGN